jgi:hypothetical protein
MDQDIFEEYSLSQNVVLKPKSGAPFEDSPVIMTCDAKIL